MAIREILTYPDERLREKAMSVQDPSSDGVRLLIDDMVETMYAAPGVGLAATQIGIHRRVAITDLAPKGEPRDLKIWINPEILHADGDAAFEEGCLSVPDIYESIDRAAFITVKWQDMEGNQHTADFEGFPAVALQHEFDHLDGVLFIDKLPLIKRRLIKNRLRKLKKKRLRDD
ncbi:MAG: peptide deformylase [Mariprofundaceae bacterium]